MEGEGSTNEFKRWITIRWVAVIIYLAIVLPFSFLPFFIDIDMTFYGWTITAMSLGGAAIILTVVVWPYLMRRERTKEWEAEEYEAEKYTPESEVYRDTVTSKVMIYSFVLVFIMLAAIFYFMPTFETFLYGILPTVVILILVGMMFGVLEIECTYNNLSFYFGPLGKDIHLGKIDDVEVTEIHPLKKYMGWGHRIGPDGSIGYISTGGKGIRIKLKDGKVYVLSSTDPERLVDYIKSAKKR